MKITKSATLNERKRVVYDTVQKEHKMQVHYSAERGIWHCAEGAQNVSA